MTDQTQFQVGRVYATRGGDRVRVTEIEPDTEYPVRGERMYMDTEDDEWHADGNYLDYGKAHKHDLLPGALPIPIPIPEAIAAWNTRVPDPALTAAQAEIASLRSLLAVAEGALGAAATALESTKGPPFGLATHVRDALTAIRAAKEKTT